MPPYAGTRHRRATAVQVGALAAFAAVVGLVALVGGRAAAGAGAEYGALERPAWAPPAWLFSPVWTVLYVMIAVAGWLVWRRTGVGWAHLPYAVQLGLNAAWTPIFFGAGAYGVAAAEIVVLWLAIGATVAAFWRVSVPAAVLMLPYWLWVSYAAALNLAIWWANR